MWENKTSITQNARQGQYGPSNSHFEQVWAWWPTQVKGAPSPESKCTSELDQFDIAGHDTESIMMVLEVVVLGFVVLVIVLCLFLKGIL